MLTADEMLALYLYQGDKTSGAPSCWHRGTIPRASWTWHQTLHMNATILPKSQQIVFPDRGQGWAHGSVGWTTGNETSMTMTLVLISI